MAMLSGTIKEVGRRKGEVLCENGKTYPFRTEVQREVHKRRTPKGKRLFEFGDHPPVSTLQAGDPVFLNLKHEGTVTAIGLFPGLTKKAGTVKPERRQAPRQGGQALLIRKVG